MSIRWWWLLGAVAGCGADRRTEDREAAWAQGMDELDLLATDARDALVRDDLPGAKAAAKKLRARLPPEPPVPLTAALDRLVAAETVREGAQAMGDLAQACKTCHAEGSASLELREVHAVSPTTGALAAEMARHGALVDGLWWSMLGGPADAAQEAFALLDQGGLPAGSPVTTRRTPGFALNPAGAALDQRVHDLAHTLRDTPTDRRGPVYADLLSACADCHHLAKVRGALADRTPPTPDPSAMNDHFVAVLELELAVVGGRVEDARAAAAKLAVAPAEVPEAWKPSLGALTEAAATVAKAPDLAAAAAGTGAVLVACGRCHQATGGGPKDPVEPPPGPDAPEMARHLYGAFWMGHGLLTPSDDAWAKGSETLAVAGLGTDDPNQGLEAEVHALARSAVPEQEAVRRGELFGQVLVTCSRCHAR